MTNTPTNIPKNTISIPKDNSLKEFFKMTKANVIKIFNLQEGTNKASALHEFLHNIDHGITHTHNVYVKALEIAKTIETSGIEIDRELLYIMSIAHDAGRFHRHEADNTTEKEQKRKISRDKKCDRHHNKCGVAQIKLGIRKLKKENITIPDEIQSKIEDYIINHDFFNTRLDGTTLQEPYSIKGQIVRLADRISIDIEDELTRYWETGKRLGTTYFNPQITFEERADFNFTNMKKYLQAHRFDELTFFLALLSITPEDFSNPILQETYKEWAKNKSRAINKIISIAGNEGYSEKDINQIKDTINRYLDKFKIKR